MPQPEKLKHKLLMPDADGEGRTDRGNTTCPFHHSLHGGGKKLSSVAAVISTLMVKVSY